MTGSTSGYSGLIQALHWTSALLILTMIGLGLVMTRIGESALQQNLYNVHIGIGLLVLGLTAGRIGALVLRRWPDPPAGLSPMNRKAFVATHVLLYLALIGLIGSGVSMLLLSNLPVIPGGVTPDAIEDVPPRFVHNVLSKAFIILLLVHVGGVVRHQLTKGDTLSRMGVRWFAGKTGTSDAAKG